MDTILIVVIVLIFHEGGSCQQGRNGIMWKTFPEFNHGGCAKRAFSGIFIQVKKAIPEDTVKVSSG